MSRAAIATGDWIAGIQILALIVYLNWLLHTGDVFAALTCLAAVGGFSIFRGMISSVVYGLAANLCFAMVLSAPLHRHTRLSFQTALAITAFFASSLALVVLVHRLRRLSTVAKVVSEQADHK